MDEIKENIVSTIKEYYPFGIAATDDRWENSAEFKRQRSLLNQLFKFQSDWLKFKKDLAKEYEVFDYSTIPSVNSCYHVKIILEDLVVSLFISAIYPGYCFHVIDQKNPKIIKWNDIDPGYKARGQFFQNCTRQHFKSYSVIPFDVLKYKIQNFSVQPFDLGEGKVFNYLFTYDPRMTLHYNK